jgi:hypothetical protein
VRLGSMNEQSPLESCACAVTEAGSADRGESLNVSVDSLLRPSGLWALVKRSPPIGPLTTTFLSLPLSLHLSSQQ